MDGNKGQIKGIVIVDIYCIFTPMLGAIKYCLGQYCGKNLSS